MASNPVSNQRSKPAGKSRSEGGSDYSGEESGASGAMSHIADEASKYWERGTSQVRELTRDHEGRAVVFALAAGFGAGILLGVAMAPTPKRRTCLRDRLTAEGLGRRIMDSIEGLIPEALAGRIGR